MTWVQGHNRQAIRAGLTALWACLLTSALFVAPFVAAHPDFGHRHPEPVPAHVHNLDTVLSPVVVAVPVVTAKAVLTVTAFLMATTTDRVPQAPAIAANGIRAPPAAG